MSRLYGVLPWGLMALGTLHMAATWRFYHELTSASLWAIRRFCLAVNVVTLCFAAVSGVVDRASWASFAFVIGLMATINILSVTALESRAAPPR